MNKKVLVMPDGNWLSHTSRPFEITKVLREMGHEIVFACDGEYTKLPRDEDFPVLPIKTIAPEHLGVTRIFGKSLTTLFFPWVKDFILTFDSRPFNKFRREKGLLPRKNIWDIWREI